MLVKRCQRDTYGSLLKQLETEHLLIVTAEQVAQNRSYFRAHASFQSPYSINLNVHAGLRRSQVTIFYTCMQWVRAWGSYKRHNSQITSYSIIIIILL